MNHSDRYYNIRLEGHVSEGWFDGLNTSRTPAGETVISGELDQAALHGLLIRIRDLGLVLLSVQSELKEKAISDGKAGQPPDSFH